MTLSRRALVAALVAIVALVVAAYFVGRTRPVVHRDTARCLSAEGAISCDLPDGSTIGVPRDVSWTDARGPGHLDGRPACLPPSGIGLEGPVGLSWVDVEVDGISWRQVVRVDCQG